MKYYNPHFDNQNNIETIYSIDMVRFNFELKGDSTNFNEFLNKYDFKPYFQLKKFMNKIGIGYKYVFNVIIDNTYDKCSFAIGLGLNCLTDNNNKGFIEFNPNKCYNVNEFIIFYNDFLSLCYSLKLVRYDIAIDIPVKRNQIKLIRNGNSNYEYLINVYQKGQILNRSITEYHGQRNHNKFTKLYDKKAESNLDYDLTRIEFTFDREEVDYNNLAQFYYYDLSIINNYDFSKVSSTQLVLIDLLRNSFDINYYLKSLSYRLRQKIKPFLADYVFNFNFDIFKTIRDELINSEFNL